LDLLEEVPIALFFKKTENSIELMDYFGITCSYFLEFKSKNKRIGGSFRYFPLKISLAIFLIKIMCLSLGDYL
jgi:hypothetical protein